MPVMKHKTDKPVLRNAKILRSEPHPEELFADDESDDHAGSGSSPGGDDDEPEDDIDDLHGIDAEELEQKFSDEVSGVTPSGVTASVTYSLQLTTTHAEAAVVERPQARQR